MSLYNDTDKQLHWLSQVLAKAGRTFIPAESDDSHTNFSFDPLSERLYTRWIPSSTGNIILALCLKSQTFMWLDEHLNILRQVNSIGRSIDNVEHEISEGMVMAVEPLTEFSKPMHYVIPDYGYSQDSIPEISKEGLHLWMLRRRLANMICSELLGLLQAHAEIRIWPHHFDTGFYTQVTSKVSNGFGCCPLIASEFNFGISIKSSVNDSI